MSIAKLRLDESTKLEFGVSITGATQEPQTRLVIEGKDYSISYPCKPTNEGVEVQINELKHVLPAGTYPVRLEVVVENKIYIPFEDTIEFDPAVEVATKTKAVEVRESIKVDKVVVKEATTPNQDRMKVATVIAEMTGYYPSLNDTPQSIVDASMARADKLKGAAKRSLHEMIKLAKEVGIKVNK
jgi:hypothetical protein